MYSNLFRRFPWLCVQESPLVVPKGPLAVQGIKGISTNIAKQVPHLLRYLSSPLKLIFKTNCLVMPEY